MCPGPRPGTFVKHLLHMPVLSDRPSLASSTSGSWCLSPQHTAVQQNLSKRNISQHVLVLPLPPAGSRSVDLVLHHVPQSLSDWVVLVGVLPATWRSAFSSFTSLLSWTSYHARFVPARRSLISSQSYHARLLWVFSLQSSCQASLPRVQKRAFHECFWSVFNYSKCQFS